MSVKDEWELSNIAKACEIAEVAFNDLLPEIKEGMTETEVAALLEYKMRKLGAQGTSFATIVAFGPHAAVPHHETGTTKLKFGDEILIDFGCKVNGYCSDITRTFLFGDDGKHEEFKKAYDAVLTAHELVLDTPAPPFVRMGEQSSSAVVIKARAWTASGDYWTVYFDVLEAVKQAFDKADIEIPYNQLDVHIKNDQ